jgi:hypothetical protein
MEIRGRVIRLIKGTDDVPAGVAAAYEEVGE